MKRTTSYIVRILAEVERVWKENPELRLAQLIANAHPGDIFYVEDQQLADEIRALDVRLSQQRKNGAQSSSS